MGEIVEFPRRREGCSRWQKGQAAISLSARPACAALAMAFAAAEAGGGMAAARASAPFSTH